MQMAVVVKVAGKAHQEVEMEVAEREAERAAERAEAERAAEARVEGKAADAMAAEARAAAHLQTPWSHAPWPLQSLGHRPTAQSSPVYPGLQ